MRKGLGFILATVAFGGWASTAHAEWSSGGGRISKDDGNPWFLENTPTVRYCVEMDETRIGLKRIEAEKAIRSALDHWTFELKALHDTSGTMFIPVGTQAFAQVTSCTYAHDVRFLIGTLPKAAQPYIQRPKSFVGAALRTAYDDKNMRATGFIYIAPDSGPLKPDLVGVPDGFWGHAGGAKLKYVLRHEVGHIFGLPHRGSEKEIMGEGYPERLVSLDAKDWELQREPNPFFSELGGLDYQWCNLIPKCAPGDLCQSFGEIVHDFFSLPKDMNCVVLKGNRYGVDVSMRADEASPELAWGHIDIRSSATLGTFLDPVIKVFTPASSGRKAGYKTAQERSSLIKAQGTYIPRSGAQRSVMLQFHPEMFEILGIKDDAISTILVGKPRERLK